MLEETFEKFASIHRLSREVIVTEKIDGTNAQICVSDDMTDLRAGSRKRWIEVGDDNFGFAHWVQENKAELLTLGPGRHYGEWWGSGIQRKYGLENGEKRFSLFNTHRWGNDETRPSCCHVVPVLTQLPAFDTVAIDAVLADLQEMGSQAAPGFMDPEGIVVFHVASQAVFKKTLGDDGHKGPR